MSEPWPRIFVHRDCLTDEQVFIAMEAWLEAKVGPSSFSSVIANGDRGDWLGVIYRIADRKVALEFRKHFLESF